MRVQAYMVHDAGGLVGGIYEVIYERFGFRLEYFLFILIFKSYKKWTVLLDLSEGIDKMHRVNFPLYSSLAA